MYFIPLSIALVCFSCCQKKDEYQTEKQNFQLTARLGGIIYPDTTPVVHIATTLFNPTKDTLSFVTMTCSYEDLFLTDDSLFKVQSRFDCYGNYPIVYNVPPNSKLDQFIMVRPISKDVKIIEHKIKIGMYLITPKTNEGLHEIINQYENRKAAKVLWSNDLDLMRLFRKIY